MAIIANSCKKYGKTELEKFNDNLKVGTIAARVVIGVVSLCFLLFLAVVGYGMLQVVFPNTFLKVEKKKSIEKEQNNMENKSVKPG